MIENEKRLDLEQNKHDNRKSDVLTLMNDLVKECDSKIESISLKLRKEISLLKECNLEVTNIKEKLLDPVQLISPNLKTYNLEEILNKTDQLEARIEILVAERDKIVNLKNRLLDSIEYFNISFRFNTDFGLNILNTQEQDRQRIARDLHDSTVQNLTVLVHKIELCSRLVEIDPIRARLELMTMSNTVKSTINEMREIIYNLRPMSLEDLGLIATVERYIQQLKLTHDIKIIFKYNNEKDNVLPVVNLAIFRVIQEACHNVIKHAQATKIEIIIFYDESNICITIRDNGIGFDMNKPKKSDDLCMSGYGLSIMRERIYLLSGELEVHSERKKGTVITISVPLIERKGEKNE